MNLVSLDYALIVAYLVLMACIGVFFGWFIKDLGSYLKGGNTIPWAIAGISNFMSMFSTFIFVAYAGIAYEHGLISIVVFWSTVPACLIAGKCFASRWRRAQITTPIEYLEKRYSAGVRQMYSWLGLLKRFLDNAVRLYASGLFLATVTPISIAEAIVVSGALITVFTMIGGLWAVTVMDTIQFIVLMCATLILLPLSLNAVDGISGIAAGEPELLHWFNGPKGAPLWLLVYFAMIALKYNENWAFVQRMYSVRDEKAAKKVAYCCAGLFLVAPVVFLVPAIAAKVYLPGLEDPEQAFVAMCSALLPAGMMGLMVASMFSATMSALNSEFNVMAGVLTNDVYKRFVRKDSSERAQFVFARVATIVVGALITTGAVFVGHFGGAFEANKLFTGILAIPLAVPMLAGLLLWRQNAASAFAVVIGGASLSLVLNIGAWFAWEVSTLFTIAACFGIYLAMGRGGNEGNEVVKAFFKRIETPLKADAIPVIDAGFKRALFKLFAFSLFVSGGFFVLVSVFTIREPSGQLALASGLLCAGIGFVFAKFSRKNEIAAEQLTGSEQ